MPISPHFPTGLSKNVRVHDLIEAFAAWSFTEFTIPRHAITQAPMGYAFVNFENAEAGASSLRLQAFYRLTAQCWRQHCVCG